MPPFIRSNLVAFGLPPLLLLLVCAAAAILAWRRGLRVSATLSLASLAAVLLLATPAGSGLLVHSLERGIPRAADTPPAAAILVLGADVSRDAELRASVGSLTLERLRRAAALHRQSGLPILVTGGPIGFEPDAPSLGALMAASLAQDFRVPTRWIEGLARDTRENAHFSQRLLRAAGVQAGYVVTHSWHLPRALDSFRQEGFAAIPAPTRWHGGPGFGRVTDWVPRPDHLVESWLAIREWTGRLAYMFRA
jgi:uncharacterized SAM-binding protein YcdF (DUF218 family)